MYIFAVFFYIQGWRFSYSLHQSVLKDVILTQTLCLFSDISSSIASDLWSALPIFLSSLSRRHNWSEWYKLLSCLDESCKLLFRIKIYIGFKTRKNNRILKWTTRVKHEIHVRWSVRPPAMEVLHDPLLVNIFSAEVFFIFFTSDSTLIKSSNKKYVHFLWLVMCRKLNPSLLLDFIYLYCLICSFIFSHSDSRLCWVVSKSQKSK